PSALRANRKVRYQMPRTDAILAAQKGRVMKSLRAAVRLLPIVLMTLTAAVPAAAQVDFSGEWAPRFHEDQPERVPGPELGDYLGLPISDAARMRGYAWEASLLTMPEWQCRP